LRNRSCAEEAYAPSWGIERLHTPQSTATQRLSNARTHKQAIGCVPQPNQTTLYRSLWRPSKSINLAPLREENLGSLRPALVRNGVIVACNETRTSAKVSPEIRPLPGHENVSGCNVARTRLRGLHSREAAAGREPAVSTPVECASMACRKA